MEFNYSFEQDAPGTRATLFISEKDQRGGAGNAFTGRYATPPLCTDSQRAGFAAILVVAETLQKERFR